MFLALAVGTFVLAERAYKAPAGAKAVLAKVPTPGEKAQIRLAALKAEPDPQVNYNNFFERMKTWVDDSMVLMADTSIAQRTQATTALTEQLRELEAPQTGEEATEELS